MEVGIVICNDGVHSVHDTSTSAMAAAKELLNGGNRVRIEVHRVISWKD